MTRTFFVNHRAVSAFIVVFLFSVMLTSAQQPSALLTLQQTEEGYVPQTGAMLGHSIAVGDINGDGIEDIVAGAPLYDEADGARDAGLCRCIFGDQSVFVAPIREVILRSPSPQDVAQFCLEVAVGDLNGDGFQDVVVGEPKYDAAGARDVGRVHIYVGGANFTGGAPITLENPEPSVGALFGVAIATGDLNGDGFDDLAVGAPLVNGERGRVYYYRGGATLGPSPTLTLNDPQPEEGARFGLTLAAGDVTGDGVDDLLVGAPTATAQGLMSAGQVVAFFGSVSFDAAADATLEDPSPELGALFGQGLAVGDVNGDRVGDVIVGAPNSDVAGRDFAADAGQVFVFFGGSPFDPDADVSLEFGSGVTSGTRLQADAHLGAPVATGDFDGDRIDDIVAGAVGIGRSSPEGRAFVYFGGPGIVAPFAGSVAFPDVLFELGGGNQNFAKFGREIDLGDVNGDLVDDIIFGVPFFDRDARVGSVGQPDAGEIFIALGRTPLFVRRPERDTMKSPVKQ